MSIIYIDWLFKSVFSIPVICNLLGLSSLVLIDVKLFDPPAELYVASGGKNEI